MPEEAVREAYRQFGIKLDEVWKEMEDYERKLSGVQEVNVQRAVRSSLPGGGVMFYSDSMAWMKDVRNQYEAGREAHERAKSLGAHLLKLYLADPEMQSAVLSDSAEDKYAADRRRLREAVLDVLTAADGLKGSLRDVMSAQEEAAPGKQGGGRRA